MIHDYAACSLVYGTRECNWPLLLSNLPHFFIGEIVDFGAFSILGLQTLNSEDWSPTDLSTELCNLKIRFFLIKILIKVTMQLNVYVGNYTHIHQQNDTQQNSCRSLNASHKKVPDYQKKGHWKHESHKNTHQLLGFFSIKTAVSSLGQVFFPPWIKIPPMGGTLSWIRSKTSMGVVAIKQPRWLGDFCFPFFFGVKKKGEHFWSWLI